MVYYCFTNIIPYSGGWWGLNIHLPAYFGVHQSSRVLTRTQAKNQIMGVQPSPSVLLNRANLNHQQWLILRVAFWWTWLRGVGCTYDIIIKQRQKHPETCFRIEYVHYDHWPLHMDISEVSQIISHPQLGFIVGFTTLSWFWLGAQDCSGMFSMTLGAGTASVIPYNWPLGAEELWWFKGINKPSCGVKPLSPENRLCLRSSFGLQFKGRKDSNKRSAPDATCVHCPFCYLSWCPLAPGPQALCPPKSPGMIECQRKSAISVGASIGGLRHLRVLPRWWRISLLFIGQALGLLLFQINFIFHHRNVMMTPSDQAYFSGELKPPISLSWWNPILKSSSFSSMVGLSRNEQWTPLPSASTSPRNLMRGILRHFVQLVAWRTIQHWSGAKKSWAKSSIIFASIAGPSLQYRL